MCCKLCKSVLLFVIPLNIRVHMCGVCVPEIGISQSASAGKNADSNPQRADCIGSARQRKYQISSHPVFGTA